jgi:hypothetical protein
MDEYSPAVAQSSHSIDSIPGHGSLPILQPIRQDTSSRHTSGLFLPLPPGCWIVPSYDDYLRCHHNHHHSTSQVKIKVTQDSNQLSFVHCNDCQVRCPAVGGRSSNRTPLLSTTTTAPGPVEGELCFRLIEVIEDISGAAPLSTLPEVASAAPSRQPSFDSPSENGPPSAGPFPRSSESALRVEDALKTEVSTNNQRSEPLTTDLVEHVDRTRTRSGLLRLLSKLKNKIKPHWHATRRSDWKRQHNPILNPQMSVRRLGKLPVALQSTSEQPTVPAGVLPVVRSTPVANDTSEAVRLEASNLESTEHCKRTKEVVSSTASRDKTTIEPKSEKELRSARPSGLLAISPIVHTVIPSELPISHSRSLNRRSHDLLHTGAHIEGFDLSLVERRGSIAVSDMNTDAQSSSEDHDFPSSPRYSGQASLQRARRRGLNTQRPPSLPNAPWSPHFRQRLRNSVDAFIYSGAENAPQIRGQASGRLSQGSTLYGSTPSVYRVVFPEPQYRHANPERDFEPPSSPSPPPSTT